MGRKNAVTSEAIANPSCSDGSLPPACGDWVVVVVLDMVIPYSIGEPGIISARWLGPRTPRGFALG
jgi:hypothetical protein